MEQGTPINPIYHSRKDNYDDEILPRLEQDGKQPLDQQPPPQPVEKKPKHEKIGIFEDSYGFFISSILAAVIGYFMFATKNIINFYGNFFSGFFAEDGTTISTRGMFIQIALVAFIHLIISYWLL